MKRQRLKALAQTSAVILNGSARAITARHRNGIHAHSATKYVGANSVALRSQLRPDLRQLFDSSKIAVRNHLGHTATAIDRGLRRVDRSGARDLRSLKKRLKQPPGAEANLADLMTSP
ncbi:MAG TPA: hypothetical protein VNQ56_12950 [Pseudolabrys sp.]|nr:hypothetical protein [Pseudolabrys sp.]